MKEAREIWDEQASEKKLLITKRIPGCKQLIRTASGSVRMKTMIVTRAQRTVPIVPSAGGTGTQNDKDEDSAKEYAIGAHSATLCLLSGHLMLAGSAKTFSERSLNTLTSCSETSTLGNE